MKRFSLFVLLTAVVFSLPVLSVKAVNAPSDLDPNGTSVSDCTNLSSANLRYRSTDYTTQGEVSLLQDFLISKGYLSGQPTGFFGVLTLQAVKDFQKASGFIPTGYVGSLTKAKIKSMTCGTSSGSNTTVPEVLTPVTGLTPPSLAPAINMESLTSSCYGIASNNPLSVKWQAKASGGKAPYKYSWKIIDNTYKYSDGNENSSAFVAYYSTSGEKNASVSVTDQTGLTSTAGCEITISNDSSVITVLTPNGGEVWSQNESRTVSWSYTGLNPNDEINIGVVSSSGLTCWFGTSPVKHGSFNIIPNSTGCGTGSDNLRDLKSGGQYKVKLVVSKYTEGRGIADMSDNYFTISSQISPAQNSITVLTPNGGEVWDANSTEKITWRDSRPVPNTTCQSISTNTKANSIVPSCIGFPSPKYNIFLSSDTGGVANIATDVKGDSYVLNLQGLKLLSGLYKVKVCSADNTVCDASDNYFNIKRSDVPYYEQVTVLSPNGGEVWSKNWQTVIKWNYIGSDIGFDIFLDPNIIGVCQAGSMSKCPSLPPISSQKIASGVFGSSFVWTSNDSVVPLGDYRIRVCKTGTSVCDSSDSTFSIIKDSSYDEKITVLTPNGGEVWDANSTQKITWRDNRPVPTTSCGSVSANTSTGGIASTCSGYVSLVKYNIFLSSDTGGVATVATDVKGDSYVLNLQGLKLQGLKLLSGLYKVKVCSADNTVCDASDNYFNIKGSATTPDYMTASMYSSNEDQAGTWGVFGPGNGAGGYLGTTDSSDWHIKTTLRVGTGKTISFVTLRQTNGEYWSTNLSSYFPLVIFENGKKLVSSYFANAGVFVEGERNWDIYAQKNRVNWEGGTLTVSFSDGSEVSATILAVPVVVPVSTLTVLNPNGGETYSSGQLININWNSTNFSVSTLNIYLSNKYDAIERIIASSVPNSGSYAWSIPKDLVPTGTSGVFKIMVGVENIALDSSDSTFTVLPSASSASVRLTSPLGSETWKIGETKTITWTGEGFDSTKANYVDVKLISLDRDSTSLIAINQPMPGSSSVGFTLKGNQVVNGVTRVSSLIPGRYKVVVACQSGNYAGYNSCMSESGVITVVDETPNIPVPEEPSITNINTGSSNGYLEKGKQYTISWTSVNVPTVMVDLVRPGYTYHLTAPSGDITNTGSLTFTVPTTVVDGNDYQIKIMYRVNALPKITVLSSVFKIYPPVATSTVAPSIQSTNNSSAVLEALKKINPSLYQ